LSWIMKKYIISRIKKVNLHLLQDLFFIEPSEINIIPLRNTSVYETKGARKHTFEIKTPFKTYSLSARSQLDMEGW